MIADAPALSLVMPTRMASVSWLAATAASDTGTNRTNRLPVLPRSRCRIGSGSLRQAAFTILGRAIVMGVLGRRVAVAIGKDRYTARNSCLAGCRAVPGAADSRGGARPRGPNVSISRGEVLLAAEVSSSRGIEQPRYRQS